MPQSTIEWTDATWNPVTGCTKVSPGCKHCYAETIASRFWGERKFTDVQCHEDRLDHPLRWRKPRMVFVNSMSDLFHEDVPFPFIRAVWDTMFRASTHTFQVLTKRPDRLARFAAWMEDQHREVVVSNIWLGVSCETQATADARIPLLLQTPATVRFLSCEPLIGPLDLSRISPNLLTSINALSGSCDIYYGPGSSMLRTNGEEKIDWVIVGGESGPKARPCHLEWIRSLAQQCAGAETACFVKQLGSNPYLDGRPYRTTHAKGGVPEEWPEDMRIREFPLAKGVRL